MKTAGPLWCFGGPIRHSSAKAGAEATAAAAPSIVRRVMCARSAVVLDCIFSLPGPIGDCGHCQLNFAGSAEPGPHRGALALALWAHYPAFRGFRAVRRPESPLRAS